MSYKSLCLARSDCLGFWGLDDAIDATSAADSGPNNVPLPKIGPLDSGKSVTGVASTDIFTSTGHGYVAGNEVQFSALTGGAGISTATNYYIIASNLAANTFQVSTTHGGAALNFTTDLTAGTVKRQHMPRLGATGFVAGLTTAADITPGEAFGVSGTSNAIFERTTAVTICGWINIVTLSTVGGWLQVFGRDQLWYNAFANTGQISAQQDTTGLTGNIYNGVRAAAQFGGAVGLGDIAFMALTWSKETGLLRCMLNGELEAEVIRDINFATGVADTFRIGTWDSSLNGTVRTSGVALFSTALGAAELRDLMAGNTSFTPPSNGSIDPPNPSTITTAGMFGAKLTLNGASIVSANGKIYRPDEYGMEGLAQGGQTQPVSSGWDAKLPFRAARVGTEWLVTQTRRPSLRLPDGGTWYDGTATSPWHSNVPAGAADPNNVSAAIFFRAGGCAILNHWVHRGVGGTDSVLTKLVSSMIDVISNQTDASGRAFPLQDGTQLQLYSDTVIAVLCMKPYVTPAKYTSWVNLLIRFGDWAADLNRGGVFNYYVNGNQNIGCLVLFYGLFLMTGNQLWLDRYNTGWNVVMYPTDWNPVTSTGVNSAWGPARTAGYGLYTYSGSGVSAWTQGTTPPAGCVRVQDDAALMALNSTTSRAFLAESPNGDGSHGVPANGIGIDHDYTQLIVNQAWKLVFLTNRAARELKLFNVLFNQHITRITPGSASASWTGDFRGGSRRDEIADPYFEMIPEYVRASGLRPDYTQNLLTHWESSSWPNWQANWHGNGQMDRYMGTNIGNILIGSPQWPGLPA